MKQKIYLLFTALLMMATTSAWADVFTLDTDNKDTNGVLYTLSGTTATVAQQRSYSGTTLTIPAQVSKDGTTYDVTSIASDAFEWCKFTSIDFGESTNITSISDWTFGNCKNLTEIILPPNIESIGGCAFTWNDKLEKVTFPTTLKTISNWAFQGDTNLKTVIFEGPTPPEIGSNAFRSEAGANSLANATIIVPNDDLVVYQNALSSISTKEILTQYQYNNRSTITWNIIDNANNTITTATSTVYYGSTANVPTSLTSIPGVTLNGTTSVTGDGEDHTINLTYTFDSSQWPFELSTSYDDATWYQMTIHSGMNIQYNATTGTLSSKYQYNDDDKYSFAFVGTPFGFKLYNKAAGNKPFGPAACTGNGTEFKVSSESDAAELLYTVNNGFKTICYKSNPSQFFNNYGGPGEQPIKTWQSSENMEFYLASLTNTNGLYFTVSGTNATVAAGENSSSDLSKRKNNQTITSKDVIVPTSITMRGTEYTVTAIDHRAFQDNKTLKSITFEGDIALNGVGTFQGCDNLETVIFKGKTSSAPASWFFALCPNLKSVTLPEGITSISDYMFGGDRNLTSLTLPSSVTSINSNAFDAWTNTGYAQYPVSTAPNVVLFADANSSLSYNNLVKGGVCETLSLHDGASFAPSAEFKANNATYSRTMSGTWGTIVLPFSAKSDDVKFYTVQKVNDNGNLVVEEEETLTAGTPAIIKKVKETTSITCTATDATETISDTINNTNATAGSYQLVGSYTQDQLIDNKNAYYIYGDTFYKNGSSFYADAFRAYLLPTSSSSTNSTSFSIVVDDDPTGINNAIGADNAAEIEGVYSVSGVKQADLQKGINIIRYRSGKTQKVILK